MIIAFVGLDQAGKSSIKVYLESLSTKNALNTSMSNGVESYLRGNMRIDVFPGQEKLRYMELLYERFFPYIDKLALIVDASARDRFDEVKRYWKFLKNMLEKYAEKEIQVILVAHKQDLSGAVSSDELCKIIFDADDIERYNVIHLNTSIFDPISMSLLLRALHGTIGLLESITEMLRVESRAQIVAIFDGHLLPIAISGTSPRSELFEKVHELVTSVEKFGYLKAFVAIFEGEKVLAISRREGNERVIICIINFEETLERVIELSNNAISHYINELRKRFWGWQ
ncbi:MAG: ADP-ribosylation factor-like protein [Candidatus Korarchaeota archaeon]